MKFDEKSNSVLQSETETNLELNFKGFFRGVFNGGGV